MQHASVFHILANHPGCALVIGYSLKPWVAWDSVVLKETVHFSFSYNAKSNSNVDNRITKFVDRAQYYLLSTSSHNFFVLFNLK